MIREFLEQHSIAYVTRPVMLRQHPPSRYAAELVERGGKAVVPYLVDPERGVEMYESRDILAYLEKHYT